ncbi:MAG: hypothetical protein HY550_00605 [Elusimicrobia bacterium]|nr:hypothetical protein [Elusimicrobiota bacterium]
MELENLYANPVAVFLGLAALVLALVYYLRWKRGKDLEELAVSLGLPFSPEGPEQGLLEGTGLEIFRLGHSRKASNLVRVQSRAGNVGVFDYRFTVGSGKNSSTRSYTLALFDCGRCEIPVFELKPETLLYKIGEAIGFKDIDLPAFPLFSDKYRLTAPDESRVHMFFTPRRAAWFERNQGLRVQGAPGHLALSKREGPLPVNAWQGFIEEAKAFAAEVLM